MPAASAAPPEPPVKLKPDKSNWKPAMPAPNSYNTSTLPEESNAPNVKIAPEQLEPSPLQTPHASSTAEPLQSPAQSAVQPGINPDSTDENNVSADDEEITILDNEISEPDTVDSNSKVARTPSPAGRLAPRNENANTKLLESDNPSKVSLDTPVNVTPSTLN